MQVQHQMRHSRCYPADEIKYQVPQRSQPIFDIVPENIQRPHIAEQVPETAVQKHERYESNDLLGGAEISADLRNRITCRYQSIGKYKLVPFWSLGQLE